MDIHAQKEIIIALDSILNHLIDKLKKEKKEACASKLHSLTGIRLLNPAQKEYWRGLTFATNATIDLLKICWKTHKQMLHHSQPRPSPQTKDSKNPGN